MLLDENFNLKLADFGFSSSKPLNETHKGTNGYKAPEIHLGEWYSGAGVDLFAAGVILFIMHTGHPPFVLPSGTDPYYKYIA
jgi:serine/threonine protein kinase